jgi:hypothetical protein
MLVAVGTAATASAQSSDAASTLASVELRTGIIPSGSFTGGPPSIGAALEFRPWSGTARRLSIHGSGDFRHLSRREGFDDELSTRARVGRSVFLLGGALGVDLVRTSQVALVARGGATFVRDYGTFEVPTGTISLTNTFEEWETGCTFAPYNRRCDTNYDVAGTATLGVRYTIRPNGGLVVGADYTRFTSGQNVFMVVVGAR